MPVQVAVCSQGRVSIDSSSCQSRARIFLELFPLFEELEQWKERRDGGESEERGRNERKKRAVLAADGEVSDRLSGALPDVTYFRALREVFVVQQLFLEENKR